RRRTPRSSRPPPSSPGPCVVVSVGGRGLARCSAAGGARGTAMTEAEWLACADPGQMLRYLERTEARPSVRKLTLFARACRAARGAGRRRALGGARRRQAALVRDLAGNPFRPAGFDPAWASADAVGLARGIYEDGAFDRLPLLADALMDAGCDQEDILAHCR